MLDSESEAKLSVALRICFPEGPVKSWSRLGSTRQLVQTVVTCLEYVLQKGGSRIRLALETAERRNGPSVVKGLIISMPGRTEVVPMTISPDLCRIRRHPYFLAHEDGAVQLMHAIINLIEGVEGESHQPRQ